VTARRGTIMRGAARAVVKPEDWPTLPQVDARLTTSTIVNVPMKAEPVVRVSWLRRIARWLLRRK
jgi:hypothetical protein